MQQYSTHYLELLTMKNYLYLVLIFLLSCEPSTQKIDDITESTATNIDLTRADITPQVDHLRIDFSWSPKVDSTSNFLFTRECSIDVNPEKVQLGKTYDLAHEAFELHATAYSLYSNFEPYRQLTGQLRFEKLEGNNCIFTLNLKGDLSKVRQVSQEKIIHEKLNIVSLHPENKRWLKHLYTGSSELSKLYTTDGVKVLDDGTAITGAAAISQFYKAHIMDIQSIRTDTVILANAQRGLSYEIGTFIADSSQRYQHLIIWQKEGETKKRTFEFIAKTGQTSSSILAEINRRRKEWMRLCNAHQTEELVQKLYSKNTLYFNHKPLVKGHAALVKEYAYMNDSQYQLSLQPIKTSLVNQHIVIEIGQCKGSYNGKYILIWKKSTEGNWEVFIDSNI